MSSRSSFLDSFCGCHHGTPLYDIIMRYVRHFRKPADPSRSYVAVLATARRDTAVLDLYYFRLRLVRSNHIPDGTQLGRATPVILSSLAPSVAAPRGRRRSH